MSKKRIGQIEQRIDRIKRELVEIGPMRPGSLTRQYKDPQNRTGAYWQISYTRQMKSRTEYVRQEWVREFRSQIKTHQRFKRLVDQWIDLGIEQSKLAMRIAEKKTTLPGRTRYSQVLNIRSGYSGHTHQRRFYEELADLEYPFGVNLRLAAQAQHLLVAGTFSFVD